MVNYIMYAKIAKYLLKKLKPEKRKHHLWVRCPHCITTQLVEVELENGINAYKCECGDFMKVKLNIKVGKWDEDWSKQAEDRRQEQKVQAGLDT
jgi:hypothetical protein